MPATRTGVAATLALALVAGGAGVAQGAGSGSRHHPAGRAAHHRRHIARHVSATAAPAPGGAAAGAGPGTTGASAPGAAGSVAGTPASGGVPSTPAPPPAPAHLQVSSREFSLTLSHAQVAAGAVAIEFLNRGQDPHDLHIRPAAGGDVAAFGLAQAGARSDQQIELSAGTYTLYCALPGHEQAGMRATLVVS